jgi:hypothetical protein
MKKKSILVVTLLLFALGISFFFVNRNIFTGSSNIADGLFIHQDISYLDLIRIDVYHLTRSQLKYLHKTHDFPKKTGYSIFNKTDIRAIYEICNKASERGSHKIVTEEYFLLKFFTNDYKFGVALVSNRDYLTIYTDRLRRKSGYPCIDCYKSIMNIINRNAVLHKNPTELAQG